MDITTETNSISLEDAAMGLLAQEPVEEETLEEEVQTTEETTDEMDVEDSAESEEEEIETEETDIEETSEEETEIDEDEDEAIEDAAQEESSDTITVKVDGEPVEVTLDELKQGYSGQKYVQKGMQEAAEQRKEAEAVYNALQNERQQVANMLQQLQSGEIGAPPVPPSKDLYDQNALEYMEQKMKYDTDKEAYDKKMESFQQVKAEQAKADKMALEAHKKREIEQLKIAIPELVDADKAKAIVSKIAEAGSKHYGYTAEEIGGVIDHRALKVLHDAMKYQEIIAGKAKAVKKTKKAKPALKPGAKKSTKPNAKKVRARQQAKLKQTGNINDAISLIMNS